MSGIMSSIRSYVKRSGRLSPTQKASLDEGSYGLRDPLPTLEHDFVGLEIGFGVGDSLLDVAKKHPEQFWIGVEVYDKGLVRVMREAAENNLTNLRLRVGDIQEVLEEIEDEALSHIRIFFPDPWHKARHHKRRLVNPAFLKKLHRVLKKKGVIHFASDNLHYAESCQEAVKEVPGFYLSDEVLERPLTKFAKKALEKGSMITDVIIRKEK